jgi:hypothetical protein
MQGGGAEDPLSCTVCTMEDTRQAETTALRLRLTRAGFTPLPLYGKAPPNKKNNKRRSMTEWEQTDNVTREMIEMWGKTWPDAGNTGVLTKQMPTIDVDINNEEAARAVEDHVREHFEERGYVLSRIGQPPKRAMPFRTDEPFDKITINLIAANGSEEEKIEFLSDGQQVVVAGIHPDTKQPYRWHSGEPGQIARHDLPYIREDEAQHLVDEIIELLVRDFNYQRAPMRPRRKSNGGKGFTIDTRSGAADWQYLIDNIRAGRELHDSLRDLAAKLIASGMSAGAAVNHLRALMEGSTEPHDERWQERYEDIPRLVDSAENLREANKPTNDPSAAQAASQATAASDLAPYTVGQTLEVFEHWLILRDPTPVYAVLGAVAANLLPGDPVWLGIIGPPSSAKTEVLNSISMLPNVVQAATLTAAALLSGTPKKQHDKGAKGGLLRQIGDFGIISLKDFGSILSMHTETRGEVLAALREIYDGAWTRHLGTDGGKTLAWKGKVGLVFGATGVIDSHYAVIGAMGDRFLLSRLAPAGRGQFDRALQHAGAATEQMRKDFAGAVAHLFAGRRPEPQPISREEVEQIDRTISLVVRLRGAIERDRQTRDIEAVYGAEGTARIGLTLERLLAGLDTLGVARETALAVVEKIALDSVPPTRRRAYEYLRDGNKAAASTPTIAAALALPTNTVRRVLEELAAYRLIERRTQGAGKADLWAALDWENEPEEAA